MSDADCTTGREPRSVAASFLLLCNKVDKQYIDKQYMPIDRAPRH